MARLSATEPFIHPDCAIVNSTFGAYTEVGQGSRIQNTDFSDYAYCDRLSDIANTSVGRFSNIAALTRIGPTDHPMTTASLHHFLYRSADYWDDVENDADFFAHRASRRTVIGADTWIGHGAVVRPDITIGTGAIVGAGAVVTRDVAPYMVVAGVPATPIRARFDTGIADRLLALAWWDWSHDRLRQALPDFRSMSAEAFLEKYETP